MKDLHITGKRRQLIISEAPKKCSICFAGTPKRRSRMVSEACLSSSRCPRWTPSAKGSWSLKASQALRGSTCTAWVLFQHHESIDVLFITSFFQVTRQTLAKQQFVTMWRPPCPCSASMPYIPLTTVSTSLGLPLQTQ